MERFFVMLFVYVVTQSGNASHKKIHAPTWGGFYSPGHGGDARI